MFFTARNLSLHQSHSHFFKNSADSIHFLRTQWLHVLQGWNSILSLSLVVHHDVPKKLRVIGSGKVLASSMSLQVAPKKLGEKKIPPFEIPKVHSHKGNLSQGLLSLEAQCRLNAGYAYNLSWFSAHFTLLTCALHLWLGACTSAEVCGLSATFQLA